jgi:hypothetical protein
MSSLRFTGILSFVLAAGAFAKGSKNPNFIERQVSTYTSDYSSLAKSAGGTEYEKSARELEALKIEIASLDAQIGSDNEKLAAKGDQFSFTKEYQKERNARSKRVQELQVRASHLEEVGDKNVKRISEFVKTRDKKLLDDLQTLRGDDDKPMTIEEGRAFATATLARLELADLKSDWKEFAHQAGGTKAALNVVRTKLDNSILGAYIHQGVLKSEGFCSAVKEASAAESCVGGSFGEPTGKAPVPVQPANEIIGKPTKGHRK